MGSTKGQGRLRLTSGIGNAPTAAQQKQLGNGTQVPCGTPPMLEVREEQLTNPLAFTTPLARQANSFASFGVNKD